MRYVFLLALLLVSPRLLAAPSLERKSEWKDLGAPFGTGASMSELVAEGDVLVARAGTGKGRQALFRSADAGRKWSKIAGNLPTFQEEFARWGHRLALSGEVILHVLPSGLVRSDNGGKTWAPVAAVPAAPAGDSWVAHAGQSFFATTAGNILESRDGGASWAPVATPKGTLWEIFASGDRLYASVTPDNDKSVRLMRREGNDWKLLTDMPSFAVAGPLLVGSFGGTSGGSRALAVSSDGGDTWSPEKPVEVQSLGSVASDGRVLVVADELSLFVADEGGARFRRIDNPLFSKKDFCSVQSLAVAGRSLVAACSVAPLSKHPQLRLFRLEGLEP